jgi:hypothetical protein
MLEYDPAIDSQKSYEVAIDAKRAELVDNIKMLREEAIERVRRAIRRGFTSRDQAAGAVDEVLSWLSKADLGMSSGQKIMFRAQVRKLALEFEVIEGNKE